MIFAHAMRDELAAELAAMHADPDNARLAEEVFRRFDDITGEYVQELTERLRLILEPTLASKLQGDYRSGKRINMKKVGRRWARCLDVWMVLQKWRMVD